MLTNVKKFSEDYQPECAQLLCDLIAIPSLSSQEQKVIDYLRKKMEVFNYDEVTVDPMGNLIGRVGSGSTVVALDAHIDTVDVGNPSLWKTDPFKGVVRNGVIYGRGASDMKGAAAAIVFAGRMAKELGLTDGITLYVVCSVQEEDCDGLCWQYILQEDQLKPDCVVITEPTNLGIYRGHRGRMEMEVRVKGLSSHGAMPERGINAIYKIAPIISEIEQLNERLAIDPFLGKGTITISNIRSTSPSLCAVADSATIHLDRRLTKGETLESAIEEIQSLPATQRADAEAEDEHGVDHGAPESAVHLAEPLHEEPLHLEQHAHPLLHLDQLGQEPELPPLELEDPVERLLVLEGEHPAEVVQAHRAHPHQPFVGHRILFPQDIHPYLLQNA